MQTLNYKRQMTKQNIIFLLYLYCSFENIWDRMKVAWWRWMYSDE